MPITDLQRRQRRQHLGSSDLPAIFGLDPFRNAGNVWLEKTGRLERDEPNPAMIAGTFLEPAILAWGESLLGPMTKNVFRSLKDEGVPLAVHADGQLKSDGSAVEAKTSNLYGFSAEREEWGDEGTDGVPERVIIQCHAHMLCLQVKVCHVPALVGGIGLRLYRIPYNEVLGNLVRETAINFWVDYIVKDVKPEIAPSIEALKAMKRTPKTVVDVNHKLVDDWLEARAARLEAEKAEDETKKQLINAIGDSECGMSRIGLVTYFEHTRAAYNVEAKTFRKLAFRDRKVP